MAASSPRRVPITPTSTAQPGAPSKGRTSKPSAKVLEARQSLRPRTATRRSAQTEEHTIDVQATQQTARPTTQPAAPQAPQHELSPSSTAARPGLPEREGGDDCSNELGRLIASLTQTIAQQSRIITSQSSIVESVRNDLADIKSEQQRFQNHGGAEGPRTTSSRTTSGGNANQEHRQLVIDVSRVEEQTAEKVTTTDAAKQIIEQGMRNAERLTRAIIKNFRV
ncbi:uncharacterized protein BDR25DRAFT_311370 [Lindgomyces ingoldianus]|uniref:Uncharacterized protein n=1 Tax=Lindgomyces ingoldianus TaxID=673940 RepID=A0ACB6R7D0_9PLEO|nr:uncharacterized protein BDR25DRAFT_311370 [Lindgomyces ingoldianus]KAF2474992.1 hypothetical protein BDR25DRAFT_311370 [Lindgomyces ingoldianus]